MNKRTLKVVITIALLSLSIVTFIVDYRLSLQDEPPLFAIETNRYKDGGTTVYTGLGYKVIDYNQIDGRKDVVFNSFFITKDNMKD